MDINLTNFLEQMTDMAEIKIYIATLLTVLSQVFGDAWYIIQFLFLFLFMDFILGFYYAIKHHKFSLKKFKEGSNKLLGYCISIILVYLTQEIVAQSFVRIPLLAWFSGYQCVTEILSMTKHLHRFGIKLPSSLHRILIEVESKFDVAIEEISDSVDTSVKKN